MTDIFLAVCSMDRVYDSKTDKYDHFAESIRSFGGKYATFWSIKSLDFETIRLYRSPMIVYFTL